VEIAPLSSVLLCLSFTLLFMWLVPVFEGWLLGSSLPYFGCCGFADPNSRLFLVLKFLLDFNNISISNTSDEMSRKSISVWMYLCRAPWYFITKCRSESLIPSLVRKVWKVLVNYDTAWPLSCHSVVHLMYWSS
jgi:hypothetical protein